MAIARDERAEVFLAAFARGGERKVFSETFDSFGFVAGHQNRLTDVDVGDGLGELEAELVVVQMGLGEVLADFEGADGEVTGDGFVDEGVGSGRGVEVVVEEIDLAGEEGALFDELGDFEAAVAGGFDVHAAVFVVLGDAVDASGAPDGSDALVEGEDDAEFAGAFEELGDHELIAFLEDV